MNPHRAHDHRTSVPHYRPTSTALPSLRRSFTAGDHPPPEKPSHHPPQPPANLHDHFPHPKTPPPPSPSHAAAIVDLLMASARAHGHLGADPSPPTGPLSISQSAYSLDSGVASLHPASSTVGAPHGHPLLRQVLPPVPMPRCPCHHPKSCRDARAKLPSMLSHLHARSLPPPSSSSTASAPPPAARPRPTDQAPASAPSPSSPSPVSPARARAVPSVPRCPSPCRDAPVMMLRAMPSLHAVLTSSLHHLLPLLRRPSFRRSPRPRFPKLTTLFEGSTKFKATRLS